MFFKENLLNLQRYFFPNLKSTKATKTEVAAAREQPMRHSSDFQLLIISFSSCNQFRFVFTLGDETDLQCFAADSFSEKRQSGGHNG